MIANVLFYGDLHLSSKNYGAHVNYPEETLEILRMITKQVEKDGVTHLIGLGDFSYGRFNSLEYREAVEAELEKQFKLVEGRRYEIKGNHDSATYGMTEFEYYIRKGLLLKSTCLSLGPVNISMIDYGEESTAPVLIERDADKINVIAAHNYPIFSDSYIGEYGKSLELDNFSRWYGVDHIISGHIHSEAVFSGMMLEKDQATGQTMGHQVTVDFPGCLSRPAWNKSISNIGHMIELAIDEEGMTYNRLDIPLAPVEEIFNIKQIEAEHTKAEEKRNRIDISDVVKSLDEHERSVGNPEDIIMAMENVPEAYKLKAIELLKAGMA